MHCFDLIDDVCHQLQQIEQTTSEDEHDKALVIALSQLCAAFTDLQGSATIREIVIRDPEELQAAFGSTADKRLSFESLVSERNIKLVGRSLDYAGWVPKPAYRTLKSYVESMQIVWRARAGIPSTILLTEMVTMTQPVEQKVCAVASEFTLARRKKYVNEELRRKAFRVVALGVAALGLAGTVVGLSVDRSEFEQQVGRWINRPDSVKVVSNFLGSTLIDRLDEEASAFDIAARSARPHRPATDRRGPRRGGPARGKPSRGRGVPPPGS